MESEKLKKEQLHEYQRFFFYRNTHSSDFPSLCSIAA